MLHPGGIASGSARRSGSFFCARNAGSPLEAKLLCDLIPLQVKNSLFRCTDAAHSIYLIRFDSRSDSFFSAIKAGSAQDIKVLLFTTQLHKDLLYLEAQSSCPGCILSGSTRGSAVFSVQTTQLRPGTRVYDCGKCFLFQRAQKHSIQYGSGALINPVDRSPQNNRSSRAAWYYSRTTTPSSNFDI